MTMGSATGDFASRASSRRYQPSRLFLSVLLLAAFSAAVEGLQYAAAGSTAARTPVQPPHSDIITHDNRLSLPSSISSPAREITTTTGVDDAADAPSTPTLSPTVDCEIDLQEGYSKKPKRLFIHLLSIEGYFSHCLIVFCGMCILFPLAWWAVRRDWKKNGFLVSENGEDQACSSRFWHAEHAGLRAITLLYVGMMFYVMITIVAGFFFRTLAPDVRCPHTRQELLSTTERRNLNYAFITLALAFVLALIGMLVGRFGLKTMLDFGMLALFRRGDEYDPKYWFAQGVHEVVEICLTTAVLAPLKYSVYNSNVFMLATCAFGFDVAAFAAMRRILKLIPKLIPSRGSVADIDRQEFQTYATIFFVFDGFSDIMQVLIALELLVGGQTGSILDQGAVVFQAFFAFFELAMTGYETGKDVLRLFILCVYKKDVDAKNYRAPPRLLRGFQLVQMVMYAGVIFVYVMIMYGRPGEGTSETRYAGCVEYMYSKADFRQSCVDRLWGEKQHLHDYQCIFPKGDGDCPPGSHKIESHHDYKFRMCYSSIYTKDECLANIEAVGCDVPGDSSMSIGFCNPPHSDEQGNWSWEDTLRVLVILTIFGQIYIAISVATVNLIGLKCVKPHWFLATAAGGEGEEDEEGQIGPVTNFDATLGSSSSSGGGGARITLLREEFVRLLKSPEDDRSEYARGLLERGNGDDCAESQLHGANDGGGGSGGVALVHRRFESASSGQGETI